MQKKILYASILGAVIAEERERKQLSQQAIAQNAMITQSAWARMELGRACSLENILKASKALELETWELFRAVDDRAKALEQQGVQVVTDAPSEEEKKSDEWLTSRALISSCSLAALPLLPLFGGIAGAVVFGAAMSGVASYIKATTQVSNEKKDE